MLPGAGYGDHVEPSEYVQALEEEGRRLLEVARDPSLPVVACPGWTVADLLWHIGEVHWFWAAIVSRGIVDRATADLHPPPRPDDVDLPAFAAEELDELAEVLAHADPTTPVWTWSEQQDVAFVQRRMALETLVHRWDAESASGDHTPLAPPLAADGVDEFLEHFLASDRAGVPALTGSVHLHATDATGEWLVTWTEGRRVLTREHAKGDAAVRGRAEDLLLVLWRRRGLDTVEVIGDRAAAESLVGLSNLE